MSQDHILVSCVTREGEILNTLRRNIPNTIAVHVPHRTCGAITQMTTPARVYDRSTTPN